MIEIIETKNVYSDGSVRATVMSDTSAELTGITSVDGTKLRFGSLALVAKEDVVCKLASNGVWYKSGISLEDVTVTPSTSQQTVTAGEGYDGIGTVTVGAVTSAIDSDIVAGNIKKDVTILGVTGTYEGSGGGSDAVLASLIDRSITSIDIPNSATELGFYAFFGCTSLASITIPDSVTSIEPGAFFGCTSLASITIPSSVTSIGQGAFMECTSLSNITIPSSVTSIGQGAFMECTSLSNITIPSSVTSIGDDAFSDCSSLTAITINKPENSISDAPWGATNATVTWTG